MFFDWGDQIKCSTLKIVIFVSKTDEKWLPSSVKQRDDKLIYKLASTSEKHKSTYYLNLVFYPSLFLETKSHQIISSQE